MPDFLQLLKQNEVVLLDGAMGTQLDAVDRGQGGLRHGAGTIRRGSRRMRPRRGGDRRRLLRHDARTHESCPRPIEKEGS